MKQLKLDLITLIRELPIFITIILAISISIATVCLTVLGITFAGEIEVDTELIIFIIFTIAICAVSFIIYHICRNTFREFRLILTTILAVPFCLAISMDAASTVFGEIGDVSFSEVVIYFILSVFFMSTMFLVVGLLSYKYMIYYAISIIAIIITIYYMMDSYVTLVDALPRYIKIIFFVAYAELLSAPFIVAAYNSRLGWRSLSLAILIYNLQCSFLIFAFAQTPDDGSDKAMVLIFLVTLFIFGGGYLSWVALYLEQRGEKWKSGKVSALLTIPILWLISVVVILPSTTLTISAAYALPLVASLIVAHQGRWGLLAVLIGLLPLLTGLNSSTFASVADHTTLGLTETTIFISQDIGLYLISVAAALLVTEEETFKRYLKSDSITWPQFSSVMLGLTLSFHIASIHLQFGDFLVLVLALVGFSRIPIRNLAIALTLVAIVSFLVPLPDRVAGFGFVSVGSLWMPLLVLYLARATRACLVGDIGLRHRNVIGEPSRGADTAGWIRLFTSPMLLLPLLAFSLLEMSMTPRGYELVSPGAAMFIAFCLGLGNGRRMVIFVSVLCALSIPLAWLLIETGVMSSFPYSYFAPPSFVGISLFGQIGVAAWGWMGWTVRRETIGLRTLFLPAPRPNAERLWRHQVAAPLQNAA